MTIDTLEYMKKLEAAGVDRKQAEEHAKAARDFLTRRIDAAGYMERLVAAGVDPAVAEIHAKAHAQMVGKATR
jgi:hypothetical protein